MSPQRQNHYPPDGCCMVDGGSIHRGQHRVFLRLQLIFNVTRYSAAKIKRGSIEMKKNQKIDLHIAVMKLRQLPNSR